MNLNKLAAWSPPHLWLYTIVGLVAILLGAVFAPIFPHIFNVPIEQHNTFSWLVFLSGIGLGISLPGAAPIAVLRGLHRFDVINLISIIGMLLLAGSTVLVLHLGGGAIGLVAVNILVNLLMQIPAVWLIHRNARQLHFGFRGAKRSHIRTVAGFSSALFVINIAGQLRAKTDEIVVGSFLSVSSVTPYSIAHRLSDLPQMLTEQFMKVLMPLSSKLHSENDQGRLRQLYIISTRLTLASFLPLGLGATILAKPFLSAWVGSAYAPYAGLVLLLVSASLFDTLMWPANAILTGNGQAPVTGSRSHRFRSGKPGHIHCPRQTAWIDWGCPGYFDPDHPGVPVLCDPLFDAGDRH